MFIDNFFFTIHFSCRVAKEYASGRNYLVLKLRYGAACPPRRTVAGWAKPVRSNQKLRKAGRPTLLSKTEEEALFGLVQQLRQVGGTINKLALQELAVETTKLMRPSTSPHIGDLSFGWVTSFRKRWGLTTMRRSTTDRVDSVESF